MYRIAAVAVLALALGVAAEVPTFPNDWSALSIQGIQINQGGVPDGHGNICCSATSPQCKIQTAYSQGMQYFDVTNQRVAFKNPDGSGVVSLFADGKEYAVNSAGVCQSYCPLQDSTLYPLAIDPNATDDGPTVYNGVHCEHYSWREEVPILNITMEVSDFYAYKDSTGAWIPIAEIDHIEPDGMQIGLQNQTFANFKAGAQDPKEFVVTGKTNCPIDQSCSKSNDDDADDDGPSNDRHARFVSSLAYKMYAAYYARYN